VRQNPNSATAAPIPLRCLCATVRRAGRLLTRRYEDALRPAGVTVPQFELMMTLRALTVAGAVNQSKLAQLLETDQTTLSRNLKLLLQQRWIEMAKDDHDARRRAYRLTTLGLAVLEVAQRCWRQVHEETERLLGVPMVELWPSLDRILSTARNAA
jgi:DNA-binding MarR family transcriptional regulator